MAPTRRQLIAVSLGLATAAVTGCARTPDKSRPPREQEQQSWTGQASWAEDFNTIAELMAQAAVAARCTVIDEPELVAADSEGVGSLQSRLYPVKVNQLWVGRTEDTILVRDRGMGFNPADVVMLEPGEESVLFLRPFVWSAGEDTGQLTVVGGLGAHLIDGDLAERTTTRSDLPRQMSIDQLRKAALAAAHGARP